MGYCFFTCVSLAGLIFSHENCTAYKLGMRKLQSTADIEAFFPQSVEEITSRKEQMLEDLQEVIEKICEETPPTFEKTGRLFDLMLGSISYGKEFIESLAPVHPDSNIRIASAMAAAEIEKAFT